MPTAPHPANPLAGSSPEAAARREQVLRDARLRVTRPRLAVIAALARHPHSAAAEVLETVRASLPQTSHQAVYDSLHALTEAGILQCIQPSGSLARYETRVGDNHHHLVCTHCGTIVDVDCALGEAPCLRPDHDHGFQVETAEVVYRGLCAACAAEPSSPSPNACPTTEGNP
ncbi:Fur family transcriptional regulator [Brachybacterium hainanense]|uniref:Fur family transcriptional regulator n=1 Tax=Brachybacterium hainanense TaxID=1541174 RepID=A0ABV6RDC4_9MICO